MSGQRDAVARHAASLRCAQDGPPLLSVSAAASTIARHTAISATNRNMARRIKSGR